MQNSTMGRKLQFPLVFFFLDFQRFEALKNFFISRPVLTLPSAGLSSKGDPKSEGSEVG